MQDIKSKCFKYANFILESIIALVIILSTNSVYNNLKNVNIHLRPILIIAVLIYIVINTWEKDIKNYVLSIKTMIVKHRKIIIFYILYLGSFLIFNRYDYKNFLLIFALILPLLVYLFMICKEEKIFKKFVNIMVVLAIISLILFLFVSVFKILKTTGTVNIRWGERSKIKSFHNIYFETQNFYVFKTYLVRNTGIFVEAPIYSLCLSIALALEEFLVKRKKYFIQAILILTIITTFSTTGIIMISCIYFLKIGNLLFIKKKIGKKVKIALIVAAVIMALISIAYFIHKMQTTSGSVRMDDYRASFKAWTSSFSSFFFGTGFQNVDIIRKNMSSFRKNNKGLSNSIMVLLAQCGIYIFTLYAYPFIRTIKKAVKDKDYNLIFFEVIIIILFITTIFTYRAIMMMILAFLYARIIKMKEEKYEEISN